MTQRLSPVSLRGVAAGARPLWRRAACLVGASGLALLPACIGDDDSDEKDGEAASTDTGAGGGGDAGEDSWFDPRWQVAGPLSATLQLTGTEGECAQLVELFGDPVPCSGCDFSFEVQQTSSDGDCSDSLQVNGVLTADNDQMYFEADPFGDIDELELGAFGTVSWSRPADELLPFDLVGVGSFRMEDVTYR